jgi:hypothetical protein
MRANRRAMLRARFRQDDAIAVALGAFLGRERLGGRMNVGARKRGAEDEQ